MANPFDPSSVMIPKGPPPDPDVLGRIIAAAREVATDLNCVGSHEHDRIARALETFADLLDGTDKRKWCEHHGAYHVDRGPWISGPPS